MEYVISSVYRLPLSIEISLFSAGPIARPVLFEKSAGVDIQPLFWQII